MIRPKWCGIQYLKHKWSQNINNSMWHLKFGIKVIDTQSTNNTISEN